MTLPKLLQTKKYADFTQSYAIGFRELANAVDWYCYAEGLTTAYEKTGLELPKIIRNSETLMILTCTQLEAKASRMIGKHVGVKNAQVAQTGGPMGGYINFALLDSNVYHSCFVKQDTQLEDIILEKPRGHFYGIIQDNPRDWCFVVSEYEPIN